MAWQTTILNILLNVLSDYIYLNVFTQLELINNSGLMKSPLRIIYVGKMYSMSIFNWYKKNHNMCITIFNPECIITCVIRSLLFIIAFPQLERINNSRRLESPLRILNVNKMNSMSFLFNLNVLSQYVHNYYQAWMSYYMSHQITLIHKRFSTAWTNQ